MDLTLRPQEHPIPETQTPMEVPAEQKEILGFYRDALQTLQRSGIPFLVGGAFALEYYAGTPQHTKDLDLFVSKNDIERILQEFSRAGYRTEVAFPHWLAKVYSNDRDGFVDIIFNSGNGLCEVDEISFDDAVPGEVLNIPVKLSSPEELVWQKSFIMERERYDGADIAHLLLTQSQRLNWTRLLHRFSQHWRVLLSHLILFGYIYPSERAKIPDWVYRRLLSRLKKELCEEPSPDRVCRGTLLSRSQYVVDIQEWKFQDARKYSAMTPQEIAQWTAAGQKKP